ncbi:hypothetical protein NUKP32_44610 [Klebsiella variicola]|nr:hypothetical protein NUKP18_56390 [Klebsiella variicola]GKJ58266.1 hypothetical protein NUKP32_44610 [Klebsiella variicola]GKJ84114.1 hypothetical protein NUKP33_52700 [Klebsiella variicola]GKM44310.1 hypothetical protein NUKP66_47340 [Klebsiella variicola]GKM62013.1 hypothetical protein NUKP67_39980 [Klebsiella variicola]
MSQNGIEADAENPCGIAASGTIHRHINNGLVCVWFGTGIAKVELKGLCAELADVTLGTGC